jgi:phosphoethanolamine N-methyltransferase
MTSKGRSVFLLSTNGIGGWIPSLTGRKTNTPSVYEIPMRQGKALIVLTGEFLKDPQRTGSPYVSVLWFVKREVYNWETVLFAEALETPPHLRAGKFFNFRTMTAEIEQNSKESTRDQFRSYWVEEHGAPTLENMMLDSNAATMDLLERPEILAELPSLNGKVVLELGAGIGRFSSSLAEKASHVTSVDFVEASCEINRNSNSHFANLKVVCEDALKLSFQSSSFDVVFSNWLLMYLSDDEVQKLANNCIEWLKPGGRIFFRESCFHRSGNVSRTWNPTIYRDPRAYFKFFNDARGSDGSRFQLCNTSCVHAYVRMKNNPNQIWWVWEKCSSGHLVQILDTQQYDYNSVFRYEKVYGEGFMSTGGLELIQKISGDYLNLLPGARVLDVGCGFGGNLLFFAEKECFVHGVDISGTMISIASERYLRYPRDIQQRISLHRADISDTVFHRNSFDFICCRDMLQYFTPTDVEVMLTKFSQWLAPGGKLLVTDYVRGPSTQTTQEFRNYMEERKYYLSTEDDTAKLMEKLGYDVEVIDAGFDKTGFISYLSKQLEEFRDLVHKKEEEVNVLKKKISEDYVFDLCYTAVNEGLKDSLADDELATSIAQASSEITKKYIEEMENVAKSERENMRWVETYWNIKKSAVQSDQLRYSIIIGKTGMC